jgi:hypothetical protein
MLDNIETFPQKAEHKKGKASPTQEKFFDLLAPYLS